MANTLQVTRAELYDAGLVRLVELGQRMVYLRENYQPIDEPMWAVIDLQQKVEALALTADIAQGDVLEGYVGETYGIPEAIYTDPVLRSLLPPIPASGSLVQNYILVVNGAALTLGGKAVVMKSVLSAQLGSPVFNTSLVPMQTVGAVTYRGDPGSTFEFDMPMNNTATGPQQMFLFVNGVQVGRVDFPTGAMGNACRLIRNGIKYLTVFQIVANTSRVDLQPE